MELEGTTTRSSAPVLVQMPDCSLVQSGEHAAGASRGIEEGADRALLAKETSLPLAKTSTPPFAFLSEL